MTDKTSNESRRKLLKTIAAGSGAIVAGKSMPEAWTKPVVDSVMLPAHASTTEPTPLPTSYSDDLDFDQETGQNSPLENVLSVLVQEAHAVQFIANEGSMCVDTSKAPTFEATVLLKDLKHGVSGLYAGTGTIGSSAAPLTFEVGCEYFGAVKIAIASIDENGAIYTVTANGGDQAAGGTAPEGNNCPVGPVECER